jgi:hypothetical protein
LGFLESYQITPEELDEAVSSNPSLQGFILGYIAELKLRKRFDADARYKGVKKFDNHDRTRKGDISFFYRGVECSIEVKSIQTNSIKKENGRITGVFQCDASDRRKVRLPSGAEIETTCLVVGEFDLVAVPLFPYIKRWDYAFAKNSDLPRVKPRRGKIREEDSEYLLATTIRITWPLEFPFQLDPVPLLDAVVKERSGKS